MQRRLSGLRESESHRSLAVNKLEASCEKRNPTAHQEEKDREK